jgi:exodeoxyribonuclease V gamma subunit
LPCEDARAALATLMQSWREGMIAPLPLACRTALAWAADVSDVAAVYEGNAFPGGGMRGEVEDACLARMFPDFESLSAEGRFIDLAARLYRPIHSWAGTHVAVEVHAVPDLVGAGPDLQGIPDE